MKLYKIFIFSALLFLVIYGCNDTKDISQPAPTIGRIIGTVTPTDAAVSIGISTASGGTIYGDPPDANGNFFMEGFPESYTISIIPKIGYSAPPSRQVLLESGKTTDAGIFNLTFNGQVSSVNYTLDGTTYIINHPYSYCNFSSPNFSIGGTTSTNPSYWFFKIQLTNVNAIGNYDVTSSGSFIQATHYSSSGVADGNWMTNNGGSAVVNIIELNKTSHVATGTFSATLVPQGATTGGNKQITNGTFNFNF